MGGQHVDVEFAGASGARICDLIIEAFLQHRSQNRRRTLSEAALSVAKEHAANGDAVELAAELMSIERNGLRAHRRVRVFAKYEEKQIRQDTIEVLFAGAARLTWPRMRALLLTDIRNSGGAVLASPQL